MSVFVFGYTVGTWPHAMTEAERRSKGKSFKVMFFFNIHLYQNLQIFREIILIFTYSSRIMAF